MSLIYNLMWLYSNDIIYTIDNLKDIYIFFDKL